MPNTDLSALRAAVQLRDRCRVAALAAHERAGLPPSVGHANSTYDAIADLIREDERRRAEAAMQRAMVPDLGPAWLHHCGTLTFGDEPVCPLRTLHALEPWYPLYVGVADLICDQTDDAGGTP